MSSMSISSNLAAPRDTPAPTQGTNSSTNAPNTNTDADNSIGGTFLTLLVQELQNQDPTAPMDSTQMVGQMISLNQLNQLTDINQLLTTQFGGTSASAANTAAINTAVTPNSVGSALAAL